MKMKLLYILLGLLFLAAGRSFGQEIKISDPVCSNDGTTLEVLLHIEAFGLDVSGGSGYRLELSIEDDETRLLLPEILYLSRDRGLYEDRKELLSGIYTLQPYEVHRKVRIDRTYVTEYKVTVPYYGWMANADVQYRFFQYGCGEDLMLAFGEPIDLKQPEELSVIVPVLPVEHEFVYEPESEPELPEIEEWIPDPEVYRAMVEFIIPDVEEIKTRNEMLHLNLEFPVNDYGIHPDYSNNYAELSRVEQLMTNVLDKELITVRNVQVRGYASPEGKFSHNEFLAKNRSLAFESYIKNKYDVVDIPVRTSWVAEDWEGLLYAMDTMAYVPMRDIMKSTIVNNLHRDPDSREWLLKIIDDRAPYQFLYENIYPSLRRIELDVDYVVYNFSDNRARDFIFTRPELLSLDEIYRVALMYDEGSEDYTRVYRIAAEQYPNDAIANNNMAAMMLRAGDAKGAYPYLEKIMKKPEAYVNIGVYYYIAGDLRKAKEYFMKAEKAGFSKGNDNIWLLTE